MRLISALILAASTLSLAAQAPATSAPADPLASLDFLLGTWTAKTNATAGSANAQVVGTYTFRRDLGGHAFARTSSEDNCKGPKDFDCSHHDQLTIFSMPGNALPSALYLDSEGHVIHYTITTPDSRTAIFLSQSAPSQHGPVFRLVYHLEGDGAKAIMSGKFQIAAPGSDDFHSYLEWSGTRQ